MVIEVVGAEGGASYDIDRGVIDLGLVSIKADDMGVEFFLRVLSACIAKKVSQVLGIESGVVSCRLKAYTDLEKIVEGREEIEYLTVEVSLPGSWSRDRVIEAVNRCPVAGLLRDKIREVRVTLSQG